MLTVLGCGRHRGHRLCAEKLGHVVVHIKHVDPHDGLALGLAAAFPPRAPLPLQVEGVEEEGHLLGRAADSNLLRVERMRQDTQVVEGMGKDEDWMGPRDEGAYRDERKELMKEKK